MKLLLIRNCIDSWTLYSYSLWICAEEQCKISSYTDFPNYFNETTMVDYRAWIKEPDRLLMWSLVDQIAVHPAPVGLVPSKVWVKGTWFLLSCVGIWILQLWCHLLVSFCTSSLYTLYYLGWRGHSSRQLFCWITLTGK